MKFETQNLKFKKGLTFVDVIVGIALILIVFLGIFAAYQLGMKVVSQSRNRIIATAIASGELEKIRNLPYEDVGIKGGFPDGILESSTTTFQNGIEFKIERKVEFVVDPADGIAAPEDDCPHDYKRVEVKVSWEGLFKGEVKLLTDIAPKNLAQECEVAGGILSVSVFDAYGAMVSSPLIEIRNPQTDEVIKSATPDSGQHYFSLPTSTYRVVVSKTDYSLEKTFGAGEVYNGKTIATPEKSHPIVLEGQLTEISFSIDKLSNFSVNTLSPFGTDFWADPFEDESKVSQSFNVTISGGEVNLTTTTEGYEDSGYLISVEISPTDLIQFDEFSFSDSEPANTDLKYQIYYASGTDWYLIPDSDLPGNSTGFDVSPVDLSNLSTTTYSQLKLRANFSTADTSVSPTLYDWQISWITSLPTPIADVTFLLEGSKIVGKDIDENPIYKYSATLTSDSSGQVEILDLEWDSYNFSVDPATGLDLVGTDPSPQPINLAPDTTLDVNLYLRSENSLLVTVQDIETLDPIFAASVTLSSATYQKTQFTDEKGKTYFIPLEEGDYNLEVSASGYLATSTQVFVSGDESKIIKLKAAE